MCANNEREKTKLKTLEDAANDFISLMGIQRSELVENYIKA